VSQVTPRARREQDRQEVEMDFFPAPVDWPEPEEHKQPVWSGPPEDMLPGVVPVELVLGRSDTAVVFLTGVRAFPSGLAFQLSVRVRGRSRHRDLNSDVFTDAPNAHRESDWQATRLKWGFQLADGQRVTNVDPSPWMERRKPDQHRPHEVDDRGWEPDHPVLHGGGGGGSSHAVDRDYWLWPLPPAGPLRVVCQWPSRGISQTVTDLDADPFLQAAARARPLWPPDG
jgi:hypothetical protein